VNAQPERLYWVGEGNLVFGEKVRVRMAGCASAGQILFRNRRERVTYSRNLVCGSVAAAAGGIARLSTGRGHTVNAGEKISDLVAVTSGALLGHHSGCCLCIVRGAVATHAGIGPERSMDALRNVSRLLRVAGCAFHFGDALRVRIFLDAGVARRAVQHGVDARLMFCLVDVDTLPGIVFQILIIVAGEAIRIGIGRGRILGGRKGSGKNSKRQSRDDP
jgi:hypothetical protein